MIGRMTDATDAPGAPAPLATQPLVAALVDDAGLFPPTALAMDDAGHTPHRFLYFPDENHWILPPQHAKLWYQVVLGFLSEHVLGEEPPAAPDLLG